MYTYSYKSLFILFLFTVTGLCSSCVSWSDDPPTVIEMPPPVEVLTPTTASTTGVKPLQALDKIAPPKSDNGELVKDIRLIIEAQEFETKEEYEAAAKKWKEALEVSSNQFANKTLEGWIRSYLKHKEITGTVDHLAGVILQELTSGSSIPYIKERQLTSIAKLAPIIKKVSEGSIVAEEASTTTVKTPIPLTPPPSKDILSTDPLLIKTASAYCNISKESKIAWKLWINSLAHGLKLYWAAITSECSKDWLTAEINYKKAINSLSLSKEYRNFALHAATQLVQRYRKSGNRLQLAKTYLKLTKIWGMSGVSEIAFGIKPIQFTERKLNDFLWAARYGAMIGDYENAKRLCQDVLDIIAKELKNKKKLPPQNLKNILEYKAEAYHTLALRVLVEEENYESAASLNIVALNTIPNMTRDWRERFEWYAALYYYAGKNYDKAIELFAKLLDVPNQSSSVKSKCYYWLARAYNAKDMNVDADKYYKQLAAEFPLSFYAVIAGSEEQKATSSSDNLNTLFENASKKTSHVITHDDFNLEPFLNESKVSRLLKRSEIAIAANLGELTNLAMAELERSTIGRYRLNENTSSSFIYLTRLQEASGFYHGAISLTSSLIQLHPDFWQKWPEQIYTYFPKPYNNTFKELSEKHSLDITWLISLSRQESSFRATAKSPVGALGLMQIMPATGSKMAKLAKLDVKKIEEALLDPSINIQLGALYVKLLKDIYKDNVPAIFAAYNAGEFAVDAWIKRRSQKDLMMWIELIPFGETREYVKNVWRNTAVYDYIFRQKNELDILSQYQLQNNHEEYAWIKF